MTSLYKLFLCIIVFLSHGPLLASEIDLEMQREVSSTSYRSLSYATVTGVMALTSGSSSLVCLSNLLLDAESGKSAMDSSWFTPTVLLMSFSGTCIVTSLGCFLRYEIDRNPQKNS